MDKAKFEPITYREDLSNYEINRKGDMRNIKTGLLLKGSISRDGYLQYTVILDNGKKATIKAHRIVAGEYLGHVRGKRYVNHKDEDRAIVCYAASSRLIACDTDAVVLDERKERFRKFFKNKKGDKKWHI